MSDKIYLPAEDNQLINDISRAILVPGLSKWHVVRLALARSLSISEAPSADFDETTEGVGGKGAELHMPQVTGLGKGPDEDLTDVFRLLLCEYHDADLFSDETTFQQLLRRHIRRGLSEFRSSWRRGNDFHDYLLEEMYNAKKPIAAVEGVSQQERVSAALTELGINFDSFSVLAGPRLERCIVRLRDSSDYDKLRKKLDDLEFLTSIKPVSISDVPGERQVGLDIPKPAGSWEFPELSEEILSSFVDQQAGELMVSPGLDVVGRPVFFDLVQAPHLFVAGTTNSGKSICLHSLILCLLRQPRSVNLVLADPKMVEFVAYKQLNMLWNGNVLTQVHEIDDVLESLLQEMERRQRLLSDRGVTNWTQLRRAGHDEPYIVVFIEELADLMMQSDVASTACVRLAQVARAAGIHLVLATQRPDSQTFSGLLRSNIPSRIALKVGKSQESAIILGSAGAERLLGKGDMLLLHAPDFPVPTRVHGYYVTSDLIARAVASANAVCAP